MEEPLNSPVIHSAQPPDFGNSFIDAFKANTLDDAASADESANSATQVTEEPKQKKSSTQKSDANTKLSRSEMDIEQMFTSKQKAPATEDSSATDDSGIPESIKSTKAADAFRKIKEEKAQLSKQLEEFKAGKSLSSNSEAQLKTLQEERDALSERVRLLDIERHPEFVKKYEGKITGVFESMKTLVGTDGDRLVGLLKSPENDYRNSQIDDIVENLSSAKRGQSSVH